FEDTQREGDVVNIFTAVHAGQHVVARASDIRRASRVVRPGEPLTSAKVGALAAIGAAGVRVYAQPRVSILTTGDEIVPPGRPIRAGQAYDINSNTIASVVRANGGVPVLLGRLSDRLTRVGASLRHGIAIV